jgi:hypothetical protein
MADKKQFSNTKSIVKVETCIVTLISYHHYLKIVGNNKLWPHMQKESWNIHGTKILICSITLNGTDSYNPRWSKSGLSVTLSYLDVCRRAHALLTLFVFASLWWCPTNIVLCLCSICLRLEYPMIPVALGCPFLIAPSIFSYVYLWYVIWIWYTGTLPTCLFKSGRTVAWSQRIRVTSVLSRKSR